MQPVTLATLYALKTPDKKMRLELEMCAVQTRRDYPGFLCARLPELSITMASMTRQCSANAKIRVELHSHWINKTVSLLDL